MTTRASLAPNALKVLVIAGCWTLIQLLSYGDTYLLIRDLIDLGKLDGSYPFWPDFLGTLVLGVVGGLVGGSILVFKVNAGYRHRTFLSGIVRSALLFAVIYLVGGVGVLFAMGFVFYALQVDLVSAIGSAWSNVLVNLYTPSFPATMVIWGILVAGTQFMLQINDKFGPGVMWKLLTGKYHHPREEERIFMFLDLKSSTSIAERLGHRRFFELLSELYQDVTSPVIESRGEIYQYVGDEVVLTWTLPRGLADDNCVRCFFRIEDAIASRRAHYLERYSVDPRFKAGLHLGEATVGEIGVIKKDIVFSGDVLNTTSRIQEECNRRGVSLLVSAPILARLPRSAGYRATPVDEIELRGRSKAIGLSAIERG
jgi:adenylate cyclase